MKKGYRRTEQVLRQESAHDKAPNFKGDEYGNVKYIKAFDLLSGWIDNNLDIYKIELSRLLWPVYVYSYLQLIHDMFPEDAKGFLEKYEWRFKDHHKDEIAQLRTVTLKTHRDENAVAKLYLDNKYRIPLNSHINYILISWLETNSQKGGQVITQILGQNCKINETTRGPIDQFSFEAIVNRARGLTGEEDVDIQEGIPGGFTGISNHDMLNNDAEIKLGPMQTEPELADDVRAELAEIDLRNPPKPGQQSYVEAYEAKIKREESADAITRNDIPLPPSKARDIIMEVQKMKESRDRFKIEGRTGGVGPGVSVCMFTFHNTFETVTCIEFSDDNNLVAVGTEESYIRVWNLHGEPLKSSLSTASDPAPSSSRRLIGHSGPVYSVSFSPSIDNPTATRNTPSTAPALLLSSSSDSTIRLWSLESFTCLVVYKGHEGPVWNVSWGPFGHYFASSGWDKTVRIWTQDHISFVRMLVGHDSSVNQIAWHGNGAYVFSASDQVDRSVRMWSVATGQCVRVFNGHSGTISAIEVSPTGKILASADIDGSIILWDLAKGTQIKRMRGHGKGGIWSLSFSVEGTVLVSGGADGTVRVWDVEVPTDPFKNGDGEVVATGGQADATRLTGAAAGAAATPAAGAGASGAATGGKKKGKDMVITPDQISAFPTKKTPVYKVKFTRTNLVVGGGCYLP